MSGHSKWSKIKRAKEATDQARGALFTKPGKAISIAASEGGGDPGMNFTLRLAIEKAKQANMPMTNIERSVKRGTGEIGGQQIVKATYEGYGPSGVALLIDTQTDNTNRTVAEVRKILEDSGGKMADAGSVAWQFEEKGLITVRPARLQKSEKYGKEDTYEDANIEEVELELLEIDGVDDIQEVESEDEEGISYPALEVFCSKSMLSEVNKKIEESGFKVEVAELIKKTKDNVAVSDDDKSRVLTLIEKLEESEDVDSVWVNAEI